MLDRPILQALLDFSEDDLYSAIGKRIKAERARIGLSQDALGRLVGLGRTSITNIESGHQRMTVHTLYSVARALGVEPTGLLPTSVPESLPDLEAVPGLTEQERDWIRSVVSPPSRSEEGIESTHQKN
jgi:transcriptional regulator with XRE-family HTH domain